MSTKDTILKIYDGRFKDIFTEVYEDNWGNISYRSDWHYFEEEIDYRFNSLGAGLTAGVEYLTFDNNSIQLQVDVSLVKNSFSTDAEPPNIDMENVIWTSWQDDNGNGLWDESEGEIFYDYGIDNCPDIYSII